MSENNETKHQIEKQKKEIENLKQQLDLCFSSLLALNNTVKEHHELLKLIVDKIKWAIFMNIYLNQKF